MGALRKAQWSCSPRALQVDTPSDCSQHASTLCAISECRLVKVRGCRQRRQATCNMRLQVCPSRQEAWALALACPTTQLVSAGTNSNASQAHYPLSTRNPAYPLLPSAFFAWLPLRGSWVELVKAASCKVSQRVSCRMCGGCRLVLPSPKAMMTCHGQCVCPVSVYATGGSWHRISLGQLSATFNPHAAMAELKSHSYSLCHRWLSPTTE